jgi:hypothetical protein
MDESHQKKNIKIKAELQKNEAKWGHNKRRKETIIFG